MKAKSIEFFSPQDNSQPAKKSVAKAPKLTGYISAAGKLVFPHKTVEQLGLDPQATRFKIGTQEGKRKLKSLYLIPGSASESDAFELVEGAKSYSIPLGVILQKKGVDYANTKYNFTIQPFDYEGDVTGYELEFEQPGPKTEYTGKPRGRKPKASSDE